MSLFSAQKSFTRDLADKTTNEVEASENNSLRYRLSKKEVEFAALSKDFKELMGRIEGEEDRLARSRHIIAVEGASPLQRLDAVLIARNESLPAGATNTSGPKASTFGTMGEARVQNEILRRNALEKKLEIMQDRIEQISTKLERCRKRNQALALQVVKLK